MDCNVVLAGIVVILNMIGFLLLTWHIDIRLKQYFGPIEYIRNGEKK